MSSPPRLGAQSCLFTTQWELEREEGLSVSSHKAKYVIACLCLWELDQAYGETVKEALV